MLSSDLENVTIPTILDGVNICRVWVKGTTGFICCSFKGGAFHVLKGISQNIFLQVPFFVLIFGTCFRLNDFKKNLETQKMKTTLPLQAVY